MKKSLIVTSAVLMFCVISGHFVFGADAANGLLRGKRLQGLFPQKVYVQNIVFPEKSLFNGENLEGWTTVGGSKDIKAWEAVDGTLHRKSGGGDLVTDMEYKNFVLDFEWKISAKGNSGLKYKFAKMGNDWLGCEYQLLDDANNGDANNPTHRTASLYDLFAAPGAEYTKPVGEYNQSRIIVNGNRIQHWLNDMLMIDSVVGSDEWEDAYKKSKFNDHDEFGRIPEGKILLQDHGNEVWFKNITLREIKPVAQTKKQWRQQTL